MAARKKPKRVVRTVKDEQYSELEMYCIWLNEYYRSLKKAGFPHDLALTIMMDKDSYPQWVPYRTTMGVDSDDEDDDGIDLL